MTITEVLLIALFGALFLFFVIALFLLIWKFNNFQKTIYFFRNNFNKRFNQNDQKINAFSELLQERMQIFQTDTIKKREEKTVSELEKWEFSVKTELDLHFTKQKKYFENNFTNLENKIKTANNYMTSLNKQMDLLKDNKEDKVDS